MSYIGNQPADIGGYAVQSETGNGVLTAFTLDRAATTASILVSIDGVDQIPTTAYAVTSGTTLTFTSPPPNLSVISIRFLGDTVSFGEPSDDSVATAKIQDDAVTAAKLANSINTEIAANTAKVTNATHTGDVTGATALTIAAGAVDIAMLSATGTASATTFLRGDNAWAAAGGANTPYFYASRTSSQSNQTVGTWAKYEGNDEILDSGGAYDPTTNYRFTPQTAGKYMICFSAAYSSSANAQRYLFSIYKNGSNYENSRASPQAGMNGQEIWGYAQAILDMNGSSDYVEAYGYLESGANTTGLVSYSAFYGWRLIE